MGGVVTPLQVQHLAVHEMNSGHRCGINDNTIVQVASQSDSMHSTTTSVVDSSEDENVMEVTPSIPEAGRN